MAAEKDDGASAVAVAVGVGAGGLRRPEELLQQLPLPLAELGERARGRVMMMMMIWFCLIGSHQA